MSHSLQWSILAVLLCAGCSTTTPQRPAAAEPPMTPGYWNAECRALGEMTYLKHEGSRPPYGWTLMRFDVEQGVVTNLEILDSSPKGVFDDAARTIYSKVRFASSGSAKACITSHKWD